MSYGLEVYNNDGSLFITPNSDITSLIAYGEVARIAINSSLTIPIPTMQNTEQFVVYTTQALMQIAPTITKGNGQLTLTNNSGSTSYYAQNIDQIQYWVFRKG